MRKELLIKTLFNLVAACIILLFHCDTAKAQTVLVYNEFSQLESRLKNAGDTALLVNFWATWCKPCVKELPYFQSFHQKNTSDKKIKVLLVSLDFKNNLDEALIPFIQKNNIKPEVVLLADPDGNTWIPKINSDWDGAIPVTLLITPGGKKFFYNRDFVAEAQLNKWITSHLN